MSINLYGNEWHYLLQLVNRIYACNNFEEVCKTIAYQLHTLIAYKQNIFFELDKHNDLPIIKDPLSFNVTGEISDSSRFLAGEYPHWSEYIMSAHSNVFRQSDLVPQNKWEKSRVYREIWQPQDNYWGLFLSVVNHDQPLLLMLFTRSRFEDDFSNKDMRILQLLSVTLEQKLLDLKTVSDFRPVGSFESRLADFSLTKRETEMIRLLCSNMDTEHICEKMVISTSTFHKHLSNIYSKTGFKNRIQLCNYFNGYTR